MKEFLVKHDDKWTLQLLDADTEENSYRVAVPSGAEIFTKFLTNSSCNGEQFFYKVMENNRLGYFKNNEWKDTLWTDNNMLNTEYNSLFSERKILWKRSGDFTKVTIDELKHRVGVEPNKITINAMNEADAMFVDATLAERQATYGSFEDVACVTQDLLSVLKRTGFDGLPKPHKEALHMICSKMARLVNGDFNHLDSWHDIGGYAKLIENLVGDEDE